MVVGCWWLFWAWVGGGVKPTLVNLVGLFAWFPIPIGGRVGVGLVPSNSSLNFSNVEVVILDSSFSFVLGGGGWLLVGGRVGWINAGGGGGELFVGWWAGLVVIGSGGGCWVLVDGLEGWIVIGGGGGWLTVGWWVGVIVLFLSFLVVGTRYSMIFRSSFAGSTGFGLFFVFIF